jgi:hypothetical protein
MKQTRLVVNTYGVPVNPAMSMISRFMVMHNPTIGSRVCILHFGFNLTGLTGLVINCLLFHDSPLYIKSTCINYDTIYNTIA